MQTKQQALNPRQAEAVQATDGPVVITAGPGSGKTRVIVQRTLHIIDTGLARPDEIMAVTFTNRATAEMTDRIRRETPPDSPQPRISTFHSYGARFLRAHSHHLNLPATFSIYDDDEQTAVLKQAIEHTGHTHWSPSDAKHRISRAKGNLLTPHQVRKLIPDFHPDPELLQESREAAAIYTEYQARLFRQWAVDFDDLLLMPVHILQNNPQVLEETSSGHRYIMVDECQDNNLAQYRLAELLASHHGNLCLVGDPDQSIYSWRGAAPKHLTKFLSENPGCRTVHLGQNYRSTPQIVHATASLISHNPPVNDRELWSENPAGPRLATHRHTEEHQEAVQVAQLVSKAHTEGLPLSEQAVLYRTNAASRPIEEALIRANIPYRIYGSTHFYRRRETRDMLAYLHVLHNHSDSLRLDRILNVPPRGIGTKTAAAVAKWRLLTNRQGLTALRSMMRQPPDQDCPKPGHKALGQLTSILNQLSDAATCQTIPELMHTLLDLTGYRQFLEKSDDHEGRIENINALIAAAADMFPGTAHDALPAMLEHASLMSEAAPTDPDQDALTISTIHQAKGLEFHTVHLTGMEHGTLPHNRSMNTTAEYQEERRLCYVAATRTKQELHLHRTANRRGFTRISDEKPRTMPATPSPFLQELLDDSDAYHRPQAPPQPPPFL